jgi:uncharacterized protein
MSDAEYQEIEQVLSHSHALTDVSEAHGTLAGALCAAADYRLDDWLRELYADGRTDGAARERLRQLFEATRSALLEQDMAFAALLPGDERPIADRAAALGQWCQGFLYGLGTSTIPDVDSLPASASEIVRDLSSITQVGVDTGESDESNESAYTELVEFVRVGAQLLFDELEPFRTPAVSAQGAESGGASGSLH